MLLRVGVSESCKETVNSADTLEDSMMFSCPAYVEAYCGRITVAFTVQWGSTEHGLLCPLFSG